MKQQETGRLIVAVCIPYCLSVSNQQPAHGTSSTVSVRHDLLSDAVGCVLTLREVRECALL